MAKRPRKFARTSPADARPRPTTTRSSRSPTPTARRSAGIPPARSASSRESTPFAATRAGELRPEGPQGRHVGDRESTSAARVRAASRPCRAWSPPASASRRSKTIRRSRTTAAVPAAPPRLNLSRSRPSRSRACRSVSGPATARFRRAARFPSRVPLTRFVRYQHASVGEVSNFHPASSPIPSSAATPSAGSPSSRSSVASAPPSATACARPALQP